jgi:hypothetical protein
MDNMDNMGGQHGQHGQSARDRDLKALRAPGVKPPRWRVGQHYGIHVYEDQRPVATFHTAADARRAVDAVNQLAQDDEPEQCAVERLERMLQANESATEFMRDSDLNRRRPQEMAASLAYVEADIAALREAIHALETCRRSSDAKGAHDR